MAEKISGASMRLRAELGIYSASKLQAGGCGLIATLSIIRVRERSYQFGMLHECSRAPG